MREKNVYTVQTKNQMCNQLFWAAGNMAAALEYGFNVTMLTFEHVDKFVLADEEKDEERIKLCWDLELADKHRRSIARRKKWLKKDNRIFDIGFDESGKRLDEALKNGSFSKYKYVEGWPFYNPATLGKYRERIARFIAPIPEIEDSAEYFIRGIQNKKRVAIHIRRKDYATYLNGMYYYDNSVYKAAMERMLTLLGEDTAFIVFTDEVEKVHELDDERWTTIISGKSAVEDLTIMSKCDYIIAPPSSFSGWASYAGNVPLYRIVDRNTPTFELKDFGVCWISEQYINNLHKRLDEQNNDGTR